MQRSCHGQKMNCRESESESYQSLLPKTWHCCQWGYGMTSTPLWPLLIAPKLGNIVVSRWGEVRQYLAQTFRWSCLEVLKDLPHMSSPHMVEDNHQLPCDSFLCLAGGSQEREGRGRSHHWYNQAWWSVRGPSVNNRTVSRKQLRGGIHNQGHLPVFFAQHQHGSL